MVTFYWCELDEEVEVRWSSLALWRTSVRTERSRYTGLIRPRFHGIWLASLDTVPYAVCVPRVESMYKTHIVGIWVFKQLV